MSKRSNKIVTEPTATGFGEMVARKVSRRGALKLSLFAGAAVAAAPVMSAMAAEGITGGTIGTGDEQKIVGFYPIEPDQTDNLSLPEGYTHTVIRSWGDPIMGSETFGFNNDYIAYFPIDMLKGGKSSSEGLLWVNHEYTSPLFVSGRAYDKAPTPEQLAKEKNSVGGSILRVRQNNGKWEFVEDAQYNRRVTGATPIDLDGPATGSDAVKGAKEVVGTVGNCAGGITPWGTALSAEENFQDYKPAVDKGGLGWGDSFIDEHYGWIVEIDPFDKTRKPVKHTAMGRFRHEGATVTVAPSGKVVVYMGYDKADEAVFKFVSKGTYNPNDRDANLKLLSEGTLYTADFSKGKWLVLDLEKQTKLKEKYKTQAEVLVNAGEAALLVGATKTDRPEDIKINPADGSVFISFTNNSGHGNFYGQITRLIEAGNNPESSDFAWEVFATGGPQRSGGGFASPDNLIFDNKGNLWVFCDVSSSVAGKGIYKFAGNNGIYVIPTTGPTAGTAYQFASGPVESEMTGPYFTPDFKTLFLSVQHPGEETLSMDKLTSNWPGGGKNMPKPSIVAITGFK